MTYSISFYKKTVARFFGVKATGKNFFALVARKRIVAFQVKNFFVHTFDYRSSCALRTIMKDEIVHFISIVQLDN